MKSDEKDFFLYLKILWKNKKLLIINFFTVCFVTALISLLLPKWYLSTTTILPPSPESTGISLSSLMQNLPFSGFGIGENSEESDLCVAILKSRTVMEEVIKKFNLIERYDVRNMEEALNTLRSRIAVRVDEEETISFIAITKTPFLASGEKNDEAKILARDMANFFIEQLDVSYRKFKTDRAKNVRSLIEKRYYQNIEDLRNAEEEVKKFQEQYGIIMLPAQETVTINAAAELKAQIIAKEIEMRVMSKYVGNSHAEYIKIKTELNEIQKKYNEFRQGTAVNSNGESGKNVDLFIALDDAPDLSLKYIRLYREVAIQEKLMEFIVPQYEDAKIQEAKDTPTIQVLDGATLPVRKFKPKRSIMVLFYGFLSLICTSSYLFFKPAIKDLYSKLNEN